MIAKYDSKADARLLCMIVTKPGRYQTIITVLLNGHLSAVVGINFAGWHAFQIRKLPKNIVYTKYRLEECSNNVPTAGKRVYDLYT